MQQGNYHKADELLRESLTINQSLGVWHEELDLVEAFRFLAAAQAQWERAVRLWGASGALKAAIGASPEPYEQEDYHRHLADARSCLGENAFAAAWAAGREMTLEQAITLALEGDGAEAMR